MCGIVGIYLKTKKFENNLGKMLSGMLNNMESRGPDSAGFAIYKNSDRKEYKYSLCINNLDFTKFKKDISKELEIYFPNYYGINVIFNTYYSLFPWKCNISRSVYYYHINTTIAITAVTATTP